MKNVVNMSQRTLNNTTSAFGKANCSCPVCTCVACACDSNGSGQCQCGSACNTNS